MQVANGGSLNYPSTLVDIVYLSIVGSLNHPSPLGIVSADDFNAKPVEIIVRATGLSGNA